MKRIVFGFVAAGAFAAALAALPAAAQGVPDTLGRIKAAKQINVAFSGDSVPFSGVGKDNKPAGYSIDLCAKVIAHIGRVIGVQDLKVNWLVGTAAVRVQMIASGKAELDCANTTETQTRMQSVDFSGLVSQETVCEGARLELEVVPAVLRCRPCEREWTIDVPAFRCPHCGGSHVAVLAGNELEVESIEVEEDIACIA